MKEPLLKLNFDIDTHCWAQVTGAFLWSLCTYAYEPCKKLWPFWPQMLCEELPEQIKNWTDDE